MKKWFGQFPYPGWIILCILFLAASIVSYQIEKSQLDQNKIVTKIQNDFKKRQAVVYVDAITGFFNRNNNNTSAVVVDQEYYWFIINNGVPINWNTNNISLPPDLVHHPDSFQNGRIKELNYTTYFVRSWELEKKDSARNFALTFIPISYNYSFENKYFQSHFLADKDIPISTKLTDVKGRNGVPIYTNNHEIAFYLHFQKDVAQFFKASFITWTLSLIFLFCIFILVHKLSMQIAKRRPFPGWLFLLAFIQVFLFLRFFIGLPQGLGNAVLFSPQLLASDNMVPSFGDLIIFSLLDTWLILFLLNYVPIERTFFSGNKLLNLLVRIGLSIFLVLVLFFVQADRIYKLIIDSKISFEVSDFTKLSEFTFLGLFVLTIITINFIFILSILLKLLNGISVRVFRYLFLLIIGLICIYFLQDKGILLFYFIILFMCLAGMILLDAFGLPFQFYFIDADLTKSSFNYVWFIILCTWISSEVLYFNYSKEKDIRKVFAGKQEQRDDALISFAFENLKSDLQEDQMIVDFLEDYNPYFDLDRQILNHYINAPLDRYQISVYYFDQDRKPFLKADSLGLAHLRKVDQLYQKEFKSGILYVNDGQSRDLYWGITPILKKKVDTVGYIGFNFAVNPRPNHSYFTSLLNRNYNLSDQQYFDRYSFAIYKNDDLWTQGGEHIFPFKSFYKVKEDQEYTFSEGWFSSTLYYKPSKEELIIVVYNRNLLVDAISLFSYILAVLLLMWGVIFFLKIFVFQPFRGKVWRRRSLNLTIRSKVNMTILGTVFLSLIVVGVITVSFLKKRYRDSQQKNLKSLVFYFSQNIINFLQENEMDLDEINPSAIRVNSKLNYRLNVLAAEQDVNINIYNKSGNLIASSQSEKIQKNFMSDYMNRSALMDLRTGRYPDLFLPERMGDLNYESLYLPLRNNKDEIIAYLNLPYYSSELELKNEISNILATLINIYTLIFLLSGLSALFISNNLIKSFRLLIQQFRTVRLKHNVLINWPYRDELGLLVKEYNAMIVKVEAMASRLATQEREEAWRDLAMQVAHEIKNPLTPMKLNIQYLQNAFAEGRTNMPELAARITKSLIEEIENLNLIATEFANFSKMPEAKPQLFDISRKLASIVEMFNLENNTEIKLITEGYSPEIIMDRSYFRRIFTNLIKNAQQAIPEGVEGVVEVIVKVAAKKVVILVKDNGTGIPLEMQRKMFTPYFTTKSSGTGIGLSMSKKMVENSHGKIWFETQEGVGTIFYVQFPVA